jgi:hypothetical protein
MSNLDDVWFRRTDDHVVAAPQRIDEYGGRPTNHSVRLHRRGLDERLPEREMDER